MFSIAGTTRVSNLSPRVRARLGRRLRSTTAAAILFSAMMLTHDAAAIEIEVGKPFPAVNLPTLDGDIRSIEDFRGTKVVLHVFASW